jgi:hypothetical protein
LHSVLVCDKAEAQAYDGTDFAHKFRIREFLGKQNSQIVSVYKARKMHVRLWSEAINFVSYGFAVLVYAVKTGFESSFALISAFLLN